MLSLQVHRCFQTKFGYKYLDGILPHKQNIALLVHFASFKKQLKPKPISFLEKEWNSNQ